MTHTHDTLVALDDAAFNRTVAELGGWRIEFGLAEDGKRAWMVYAPGGYMITEMGYTSDDAAWRAVPDYANDLNAAWGLPFDAPWNVNLLKIGNATLFVRVSSAFEDSVKIHFVNTNSMTPARTVATAWVLWKQEQENEQ